MKTIRDVILVSGLILVLGINVSADNRTESKHPDKDIKNEQESAKYKPDNSGKNIRDRNDNRLTADDQSSSVNDTELAANVRASVVQEEKLSTIAHNVKIIAQNGIVTLRGPVKSAEEKEIIGNKAVQYAGLNNVKNELEIEVR